LLLQHSKHIHNARARKRAHPRFFEKKIDYLDRGKRLTGIHSKVVNSILAIFRIITFHSIPSGQFQIGVDIFTFAKFRSYVITYGSFQKHAFLVFLTKSRILNANSSRSLMKLSPSRTGFSAFLLGIGSPSRPLLHTLKCAVSVC